MTTFKVAVIGCGTISSFRHLPEYEAEENVEIAAVCDIVESRAIKMSEKYDAKPYTDYRELLKDDTIDAVSVCLPNALHAPVTIASLQAGKHVLCEKPMATSKQEAEEMIQAAEESGKQLMIGHNQRFVPSHEKAKKLIASGELGKIYSFRTAFGHGGPEGWSVDGKDSWFFDKKQAFIGTLGDLGVHKTDLMRYILGEEFVEVGAFVETSAKENSDVDDNAVCVLKTKSGIIGTLAASWSYVPNEDNSTVIYAEKGIIRLEDDPEYSMIVQYQSGEVVNYKLGGIQSNDSGGQTSSDVIHRFIRSIDRNEASPISGREGLNSLAVILAALKSNETKTIVRIDE
ncbi:Gfo/Idh/MocA family protein [Salipaludibacillus daqingensis]|uniref:Gfo/Idh/MocA family protein n=1 Tax=Salipaludibacillus daqingensis TaxID=3041001 RepID=UPI002474C0ED|nr:Gfo/Idh/MocA family oxidoreductase [Salipaludibacillus daqingensis]